MVEPTPSGFRFEHVVVTAADGARMLADADGELPTAGVVALVGPSGSGKTTLLRCCNRLEAPTSGRVLLDGGDVAELDPLRLRRRVGMVLQRPTPFAGTVVDNLRVADPAADDARLSDALARVGLDAGLSERAADDLSGGESQRMCLARTLLTDPEVVLMDEVTTSVDVDATERIEELARRLAADGTGVVWVTHDLAQAERLADTTLVVVAGRLAPAEVAGRCLDERSFDSAQRWAGAEAERAAEDRVEREGTT